MEMQFIEQNLNWIIPLALLEFVVKPFALWYAARANQKVWFAGLFLLNTAGILPAIYLIFVRPQQKRRKA